MKKLGLSILGFCLLLGITAPIMNAEARNSGTGVTTQTSSWHSVEWGHRAEEAFTAHTQRHARATASVWREDSNVENQATAQHHGQTARAALQISAVTERGHNWWSRP